MMRLACVCIACLLWPALGAGQDIVGPPEPSGSLFSDEVIHLRIDLMVQRSETIQARSDRLRIEEQLLEMDRRDFRVDLDALQGQLDAHCGGTYDMVARACATDPPEPALDPSEEDDPL